MTTPTNPEPAERALPCRVCGGPTKPGIAYVPILYGSPDFPGDTGSEEGCTISEGPALYPSSVLKCEECGHSFTAPLRPTTDPAPTAAETITPEELRAHLDDMLARAAAAESQGTPRTDAEVFSFFSKSGEKHVQVVGVKFARTLERETQQLRIKAQYDLEEAERKAETELSELRNVNARLVEQLAEASDLSRLATDKLNEERGELFSLRAQLAKETEVRAELLATIHRIAKECDEARAQLAEAEMTSKEAVMRMREQAEACTTKLAQAAAEDGYSHLNDSDMSDAELIAALFDLLLDVSDDESQSSGTILSKVTAMKGLFAECDDIKARLDAASEDSAIASWMRANWPQYVATATRAIDAARKQQY